MDPLSALSIASNIIQFVSFGYKVTKRLREYTSAVAGEVPKSLQIISSQLPLLLNALDRVKSDVEDERFDLDTRCILKGVVAGCMDQVAKVERIVEKVLHVPEESLAAKARRTFVSLNSDDKLSAVEKNLQTYISVLILHRVIDNSVAVPATAEESVYFDVREKKVSPFYERDDLIKEIDTHLHDAATSQTKKPIAVILAGEVGVGKTQLALEYCHQVHALGHFQTIFWLNASTSENLDLSLESVAATVRRSKEGSRQDKIKFVKTFLEERWHPWLLVLHNYDHIEFNNVMDALPSRGCGAILFTTLRAKAIDLGHIIRVPKYLSENERESLRARLSGAIEGKQVGEIYTLIANGADVNGLTNIGWPFINRAALFGLEGPVKVMLDRGAKPRSDADANGYGTALHWAADHGATSVVRMLLDHEEATNSVAKVPGYDVPFRAAAKNGREDVLRMILARRDVQIESKGYQTQTALNSAASEGHTAVVKLLLDHGANPDGGNPEKSPIVDAARSGHFETMKALCTHSKSHFGTLPKDSWMALMEAAGYQEPMTNRESGLEMVEFLLDAGVDPNPPGKKETPLGEAALRDHTNKVQLLLKYGAKPYLENRLGYSALEAAMKFNSPKAVTMLLKVNIPDPTTRTQYLQSGLKYASRIGNREMVLLVLESYPALDLNTKDWRGQTPLLLAILKPDVPTARLLLRRGARQDIPDNEGRLPLLVAAENGFDTLVREMLKAKGNPDVKDEKEDTALCLAAAKGHEKVVKALLDGGADREIGNRYGDTAIDLAEEKGFKKVIQVLEGLEVKD